jgi:4-hydroxybenzoate polyprenyltransferase
MLQTRKQPSIALDVLRLLRPRDWSKNLFVLAPLVFGEAYHSGRLAAAAFLALACFCLWASAIYMINDMLDSNSDRQHPRKCQRPIAAGRIAPGAAIVLGVSAAIVGAVVACILLPLPFLLFGSLYLCNGLLYCFVTKHYVILDIMAIAMGFVLRLLGGCEAVSVAPSHWLLICGFSLALLLGFGKRRMELTGLGSAKDYRATLGSYSAQNLDLALGIASSVCLMAYMLYTIAPETVQIHRTDRLIYTAPFVAYGVFRYIFLVQEAQADGPVEILFSEPVFFFNGILWLATVLAILSLK